MKSKISALVVGKVSSPIFIIIFWRYPLFYSEKYSVIFMSPTCFACVFFNLLLLGGYAAVASPSSNLEVVDYWHLIVTTLFNIKILLQ